MKQNYIANDATIKNCTIGKQVKIYKQAELKDSQLDDLVTIGDQTIVLQSTIASHTSLNRRNYILRSAIGSYTYTGIGTMIRSAEVGSFCSLSWNVSIGGGDHDYDYVTTSPLWRFNMLDEGNHNHATNQELSKRFEQQAHCTIGNDVWIASNVVILRDVQIGNGAIIGAGAIVTKDVQPYSIVVGVPARVVKKRFNEQTIEAFEQIKWWSWPNSMIRKHKDLIFSKKVDEPLLEKLQEISEQINESTES